MKNHLLSLMILAALCSVRAFAQQADAQPVAGSEAERLQYPMMDYESPKMYTVKDVKISGLKFLDSNTLMAVAGLKPGDKAMIPGGYISAAMTKLWNMRNFSDVNITAEFDGDEVTLFVQLTERPRVNSWNIEGIRSGQADDIKDKLKIKRGGSELSDYLIDKNVKGIKDYLIDKSFLNADVDVRIDNAPNADGRNIVDVTFIVDRGPRVKIGDIVFDGNEAFDDKRLRRAFKKTHKKSLNIFRNTKFNEKEFEADKENLIDYYNSKGYRNADVVSDSVYKISDNRVGIKVKVDEGNQFFIRDVDWVGNSLYNTEYLSSLFDLDKGDIYDKKKINKNLGIGSGDNPEDPSTVSSLYQNEGYLFSQIEPIETIIGQDSIDITVNIIEGKPARWNEVNIVGNYRVNDDVIRRELATLPGDLYNRALIMRTLRLLAGMQHFNAEALAPQISDVPGRKDLVDLTWSLEEQASDRAEVSGGWGAGMFVGSVSLILNNVSLRNFFKKEEWRPYPQGQNQKIAIRAQTNGKYYSAFSLGFTDPWFGGKKPNSLSVNAHYSSETNATSFGRRATKHFRTTGLSAGIGRRLNWPDQNFTLYSELSYQAYMLKDWNYFIINNGTSNVIALNTVFARNTIDNPVFPSSGSEFSLSLSLTPPYSLFDGRDYKDKNLPDQKRYGWIEYHKWKLKGEWYSTIARAFDRNLVVMAKAELGYLGSYNKNKVSPFEGFDVGGDGMSGYNIYGVDVIGLRGYENGALTPLSATGDYARVYNKVTVELRYPVVMSAQAQAYVLAFAEGGNAFANWDKFDPFKLKRSAGAGVRVVLPIVGMIGIDWAYGFDRPPGASKKSGGQLHYVFGTQF